MFKNIEKTELLNIVQGISLERGKYTNRLSHGLLFRGSGETRYYFRDSTVLHSEGEVLFLPKGEDYMVEKQSVGEGWYIAVNFTGEHLPDRPAVVDIFNKVDYRHLCTRLTRCISPDTAAEKFRRQALFYEILALVCEASAPAYMTSDGRDQIEPAVAFLRQHLFDPGLQVGQLHILCGISDTYFRKLFASRFGVTPGKYVLHRRLGHAKDLLDNGEYNSIGEVARLSGFDDPLYFSKVFRRQYGCPPSRWQRTCLPSGCVVY